MHAPATRTRTTRARLHEILAQTRRRDRLSRILNLGLIILIVANVISVILETVPHYSERHHLFFFWFDHVSVALFTAEYALRVWTAVEERQHGESALGARLRFMASPGAVIDLLAVLPAWLAFLIPIDLRVLRVLRLLRLLKLTRYSSALSLLSDVIVRERNALLACLFVLAILIVVAASGAWLAEHKAQPDRFGSIPDAMWWAVVTLTTVGYGDSFPVTPVGKLFGAAVLILGVGMAALPAGILATGFADQLAQRRREFEDRYFRALADGVIDPDEEKELEFVRREYGISRERARQIQARARQLREEPLRCPHCGGALHAHHLTR
jgi:voltage-gated potassium channel